MMTTMKEQLYSFYQFPDSKTIWKGNFFLNFLFQEMSLKRDIFVNFLPQKFKIKYGIFSTYSINFVSQKILVCLQCKYLIYQELFVKCTFLSPINPFVLIKPPTYFAWFRTS